MSDQPPPQQPNPGQPNPEQYPQGGQPYPPQGGQSGGYPPQGGQYGPPPGYYQQPPKKKKKWPWILGGIILFFVLIFGGCMALIGGVATELDRESEREVTVTYEVEGDTQSASITYSGRDFNTAQDTNVALPWTTDVTIAGLGKTVSLSASNDYDTGGQITCRIRVGEQVISEQTSSGPFATASCIGNAGDATDE
ncbi:MmpS family transport accessory protein [Hoyosella altamirensis]|uniref:MmpS family membrane protein n=1 Tax=Hoyosella altamirensis TaxID=616997 RepID=A0A839RTN8_9ACTN|nr:MmpS family transport accessory protein [Hoyosella altamirensis]MBB3039586.1 hypothetical protein [Hoyosella altamirensis]